MTMEPWNPIGCGCVYRGCSKEQPRISNGFACSGLIEKRKRHFQSGYNILSGQKITRTARADWHDASGSGRGQYSLGGGAGN